ncbi:MAG: GNAT family N-acetyltransferase [Glaciecola sp.]|jgi:predicted N-acyltransferase
MDLSWKFIVSVDDIAPALWQQLIDDKPDFCTPFLSLHFLKGLEQSKCVGQGTGWISQHIAVFEKEKLLAFLPCYLKTHSYGEYVFDHAWANAYQHHQIPYYPKLVCCIPFTPVTGSRLLLRQDTNIKSDEIYEFIGKHVEDIVQRATASSFHTLFLPEKNSKQLEPFGIMPRISVQFIWQNNAYRDFDDFLDEMTSRKRRSIKKERAKLQQDNSEIKQLCGEDITERVLDDFYLCYQQTYLKRSGHTGYLNREFFTYLQKHMRQSLMIVMAFEDDNCIASALFFYNEQLLCGRYWGALKELSGLHFECCYYQGIEFCIQNKIQTFNPGTQGEHKILRGFRPSYCYSNHYLQHPDFRSAVADFLERETLGVQQYKHQADSVLPFKQD